MRAIRTFVVLSTACVLAACDDGAREQMETQMMAMQERLVELETQVTDSEGHAARLTTAVSELEAYVRDVEMEVIDLSAHVPRDLLVDVEATLGNTKTKLEEVRARTDALGSVLRPDYPEE